jgi:hypothetical protein
MAWSDSVIACASYKCDSDNHSDVECNLLSAGLWVTSLELVTSCVREIPTYNVSQVPTVSLRMIIGAVSHVMAWQHFRVRRNPIYSNFISWNTNCIFFALQVQFGHCLFFITSEKHTLFESGRYLFLDERCDRVNNRSVRVENQRKNEKQIKRNE